MIGQTPSWPTSARSSALRRNKPEPPERRVAVAGFGAFATQPEPAAADFAPCVVEPGLRRSFLVVEGRQLAADEGARHPSKAILAQHFRDLADLRALAGQGGENFDVCAAQQGRPRGVSGPDRDRGVPAALGDEDLGVKPAEIAFLDLLAVFGSGGVRQYFDTIESVERCAVKTRQLLGPSNQHGRLGARQRREHLQCLVVAEGGDDPEAVAGLRTPHPSVKTVDRKGHILKRIGQGPLDAPQVFGQFVDKGATSIRRPSRRQSGERSNEVCKRTIDCLRLVRDVAVEGQREIPTPIPGKVSREDQQTQAPGLLGSKRCEAQRPHLRVKRPFTRRRDLHDHSFEQRAYAGVGAHVAFDVAGVREDQQSPRDAFDPLQQRERVQQDLVPIFSGKERKTDRRRQRRFKIHGVGRGDPCVEDVPCRRLKACSVKRPPLGIQDAPRRHGRGPADTSGPGSTEN